MTHYYVKIFFCFAILKTTSLIVSADFVRPSTSHSVKSKQLQFSSQLKPLPSSATNFAILESRDLDSLTSSKFTICGSIYIGFYRGFPNFYTVRRNDHTTLWFSLSMDNQDTREEAYKTVFTYFGGSVLSNTGVKLRLRPHGWSHACTNIDGESGQVTVVINGILTHNMTISSKHFTDQVPIIFQNNLVLGIRQSKYLGTANKNTQSEASVTNINVFSTAMNETQMYDVTSTGQWTEGDIVSWSKAVWSLSGNVETLTKETNGHASTFPNLFKMANGFLSAYDCMNLCPRIQAGGRLPFIYNALDAEKLARLFYHPESRNWFWSPFIYQSEGMFTDYYTGSAIPPNMWLAGQPNGGSEQQCTNWGGNNPKGTLFDDSCIFASLKLQCLCQFDASPILRMRGLCKGSNIDTHFTLKSLNGSVAFMGLTNTMIQFLPTSTISKWTMTINQKETMATTRAIDTSFILGRYKWIIDKDSPECHEGEAYNSQLKMSGCNTDGEFTCDDGQCVTMEQRCDQVPEV